jgi:hypothetical protein
LSINASTRGSCLSRQRKSARCSTASVSLVGGLEDTYKRLDLALYASLCLGLAAGTVMPSAGPWLYQRRSTMRLPNTAHTFRPWRVHEFTTDFELEDVWELPTPGGRDDLARLVQQTASPTGGSEFPAAFRALFALRWKLGELFGWDRADSGVGERVRSLRERLPADLLEGPRGPDLRAVPGRTEVEGPPVFHSVYQTREEWVAEFCNKTVHSLMHIGWVSDQSGGGYHAQMAVLVKPNGWPGRVYMAAIKPFRYLLVYPILLRSIGRRWQQEA